MRGPLNRGHLKIPLRNRGWCIGPADCNHCNCNHNLSGESSSCQKCHLYSAKPTPPFPMFLYTSLLYMFVYVYMFIHIICCYMFLSLYIYIYIYRERERCMYVCMCIYIYIYVAIRMLCWGTSLFVVGKR